MTKVINLFGVIEAGLGYIENIEKSAPKGLAGDWLLH